MAVSTEEEKHDTITSLSMTERRTFELESESKRYTSTLSQKIEKPVFVTKLSPMISSVGETAKFTVIASGFPKPDVQWKHNGQVIVSSSIYKFIQERDEYTLIVTKVRKETEGEYLCTVRNEYGESTCASYLHVKVKDARQLEKPKGQPPCFTKEINSVQCTVGSQAQFQYTVTGTPLPEIQWFRGEFQMHPSKYCVIMSNPDGFGFMKMTSLQQEDSGLYTCTAVNLFGEALCSAELIVLRETVATSRHQEQVVTQKQKSYKVSVTEQTTESRLYMVNIPGEARDNQQAGRQKICIGTEDTQVVASEQVENLREVDMSAATIHTEQLTHQAAVLQSHEVQETVTMGPTLPQPAVAIPVKQLHTTALTSSIEENQGFIEQHSERIKSPEITELEFERELPSKLMSATSENITGFSIVRAETFAGRKEEETKTTAEPKYPLSGYQVETTLPILREQYQSIPLPEQERGFRVAEGVKLLYSATSSQNLQISEGHTSDLSASETTQGLVRKELRKPTLAGVSEMKHILAKVEKFEVHKPKEEVADLSKDKVFLSALNAEEKLELKADHVAKIPGIESAESVTTQKEKEQILHLQVISDQDVLPSESRFTCEKPSEEQANVRKSPTLLHSVSTDEQRTVTCEDSAHFSSEKTTLTLQPQKEPTGTLHLQSVQEVYPLTKEAILTHEKPEEHSAMQRQEKARKHAVTTEEKRELTADYIKDLHVSVTGIKSNYKKEPKPQNILQVISESLQLPKETPFATAIEQQRALVQKEDRWNIVHVTSISDRQVLEEGHTDQLKAAEKFTCETGMEPKMPTQPLHIEEKAVSTESSVALESAEQDFAVQIQEGQSVRQAILMEEKHVLMGEMSKCITKSESIKVDATTQPKRPLLVSESRESKTLPKELTFVIPAPKPQSLDIRYQLKTALQSAVARDQPLILADVVQSLGVVDVKEPTIRKEPKFTMFTYLITTTSIPIEITIAFEGDYPQTADLKSELQAAFYSIVYQECQILTSAQSGTLQIDRPQKLQVKSASRKEMLTSVVGTVLTSESVSDIKLARMQSAAVKTEAKTSFETIIAQEQPLVQEATRISKPEIRSMTVNGLEKDAGAANITTAVSCAPIPLEQSADVVVHRELKEEFLSEEITISKTVEQIQNYPIIEKPLNDMSVEDGSKVDFSVNIKCVKNVKWFFNGKLVKSGIEFKCSKSRDTHMLVIDKVKKDKHQGEYVCEAENEAGKTSTSSRLTVISRGWIIRMF